MKKREKGGERRYYPRLKAGIRNTQMGELHTKQGKRARIILQFGSSWIMMNAVRTREGLPSGPCRERRFEDDFEE